MPRAPNMVCSTRRLRKQRRFPSGASWRRMAIFMLDTEPQKFQEASKQFAIRSMSETGIFALPPFFNRAKQPPQQQWRIPSVLGARTSSSIDRNCSRKICVQYVRIELRNNVFISSVIPAVIAVLTSSEAGPGPSEEPALRYARSEGRSPPAREAGAQIGARLSERRGLLTRGLGYAPSCGSCS
jgi:hypothetical protein